MSLKSATLIALIGAAIAVILVFLPIFGGLYPLLYRSILGIIIRAIPDVAYLIFFVTLFIRQRSKNNGQ